jgi:hypothetical protein
MHAHTIPLSHTCTPNMCCSLSLVNTYTLSFSPFPPPLSSSRSFSRTHAHTHTHTQVPDTENGGGRYERVSNLEKRPALSGVCMCVACAIEKAREEERGRGRERKRVCTKNTKCVSAFCMSCFCGCVEVWMCEHGPSNGVREGGGGGG